MKVWRYLETGAGEKGKKGEKKKKEQGEEQSRVIFCVTPLVLTPIPSAHLLKEFLQSHYEKGFILFFSLLSNSVDFDSGWEATKAH